MNITVTFKHMDSTEAVKSYAETKMSKLEKYLNNILEAHLTLSVERVGHKESGVASIKLTGKNLNMNAEEKSSDIYSAIDLLMEKIESQLKKHKEKTRRKEISRNAQAAQLKEMGAASLSGEPGEIDPDLEVRSDYEKKPLSINDALAKLKKKNRDFIIFKNAVSSKVAVILRGSDGKFSFIEPDL